MSAHRSSNTPRPSLFLFVLFALLLIAPVVSGVAQSDPIRTLPTQAPTATMGVLQANPTESPDLPIQANPTRTPTPRPPDRPDDVVANPTDVPRGPDEVVANPTEAPEREIDDVQANPTDAPETEIDDLQANPTEPGTLTVHKWVCPAFYDPLAGSPLDDCAESLNGVTFSFDNHDPGQPDLQAVTGDTIDGAAVFEAQPGTYSLAEQIPDGYDQPFLWDCTGLDNPAAIGSPLSTINFFRIVIGSGQDIACDWMNVIDNDNHIVSVHAYACPEGVNPSDAFWTTSTDCVDPLEGVAFSLATDGGMVDGLTDAGGRFSWTDVDLGDSGEIQIAESIPAGYGEPEVWCVSTPEAAGDAQDYEFFEAQAVDGLVTALPEQHEPYRFSCFFFHGGEGGVGAIDDVLVANPTPTPRTDIDDLQANPTEAPGIDDVEANPVSGTVRVVKRDCPLGVVDDAFLSEYLVICTESHNGVEFTLDYAGGSEAAVTAGGEAAWTGVVPGAFEIQETLPAGYGDPIVFCGFTESPGGGVRHPSLKASAGGLVTGALVRFGSEYVCYWMNVPSTPLVGTGPGSVANPGGGDGDGTLELTVRACPDGIATGPDLDDYQETCTETVDGAGFTLTTEAASVGKPVEAGQVQWTGLPLGEFILEGAVPSRTGDPIVFCGWTAIHNGAIYDAFPSLSPSPGGVVEGEVTVPNTSSFCFWFHEEGVPGAIGR